MSEGLFDKSSEYDDMLGRGLAVTGDDKMFYMRGRIANMAGRLPDSFTPRKILDFGCGLGETSHELSLIFPEAEITGIDTAENAIEYAKKKYGSSRTHFANAAGFEGNGTFDLCYVNGVFHHILPQDRPGLVGMIHRALKTGGYFGFYENNPWNPGTRLVMGLIEFDRVAIPLSYLKAEKLLASGGFQIADQSEFIFYFPKWVSFLRALEPALRKIPLGAQYGVLGRKI